MGAQKLDNPAAHRTDQNELRSFYKKLLKPWKLPFARRNPRWNVSQPVKEKIFWIFSSAWLNWLNWQLHFWPQNFFKTLPQWRSWCLIGGRGKDCLVPKGHISLRMRQTLGLFVVIAMMSREEIPHTYSRLEYHPVNAWVLSQDKQSPGVRGPRFLGKEVGVGSG